MAKKREAIFDLTNYKENVGARVDEGRYRVVVEDAEVTESKNGNAMINLWLRIVDPGGEFDGATIIDRLVDSEKALFRVVNFLQALGLPTPKKRIKLPIDKIVGKHLLVDVEDGEPYKNRIKSEVRGYARLEKKAKDDDDADDLDEFAADEDDDDEDLDVDEDDSDDVEDDDTDEDDEDSDDDDPDDEDEDEDDEPEPKPKKKATKKSAAKKGKSTKKKKAEDDAEAVDLDDLDLG